jgi:hypothetical protein
LGTLQSGEDAGGISDQASNRLIRLDSAFDLSFSGEAIRAGKQGMSSSKSSSFPPV